MTKPMFCGEDARVCTCTFHVALRHIIMLKLYDQDGNYVVTV